MAVADVVLMEEIQPAVLYLMMIIYDYADYPTLSLPIVCLLRTFSFRVSSLNVKVLARPVGESKVK